MTRKICDTSKIVMQLLEIMKSAKFLNNGKLFLFTGRKNGSGMTLTEK